MNIDKSKAWHDNEQDYELGQGLFLKLPVGTHELLFMDDGEVVETPFKDKQENVKLAVRFNPVYLLNDNGYDSEPHVLEIQATKLIKKLRILHNRAKDNSLVGKTIHIEVTKDKNNYNDYDVTPLYDNTPDKLPPTTPVELKPREEDQTKLKEASKSWD